MSALERTLEKYKIYFLPQRRSEEGEGFTQPEEMGNGSDLGSSGGGMEKVQENRQMINENVRRIVRIDERTAFMARMLFGILVAFVVSVGVAVIVSFLPY